MPTAIAVGNWWAGIPPGCTKFKVEEKPLVSFHEGKVSEWSNELVSKTSVAQATVGSNPTLSALRPDVTSGLSVLF